MTDANGAEIDMDALTQKVDAAADWQAAIDGAVADREGYALTPAEVDAGTAAMLDRRYEYADNGLLGAFRPAAAVAGLVRTADDAGRLLYAVVCGLRMHGVGGNAGLPVSEPEAAASGLHVWHALAVVRSDLRAGRWGTAAGMAGSVRLARDAAVRDRGRNAGVDHVRVLLEALADAERAARQAAGGADE